MALLARAFRGWQALAGRRMGIPETFFSTLKAEFAELNS
jgi:hypothetical protein